MKKITLLILNYNGANHLRTFLPSVVEFSSSDLCDVVVADNGSSDDSVELLRMQFPTVGIIRLDKNYGFAGGYNMAIAQVLTPYVMLLNSDVEVSEGYLEPLYELISGDENIAAVMPKIRSYLNKPYFEYAGAAGGFIDSLGYPFCKGRILNTLEKDDGQYDNVAQVFWASGAAMLVRRDVYVDAGELDSDFFAHMEEIDLCWRMQLMGYKIMVEPQSVVYHLGGGTLSKESPRKTFLNYRNNLAMLYKNLPKKTLFFTLLVRMLLDGASGLVYLFTGRFKLVSAVIEAHLDFYRMLPKLRVKRLKISELGGNKITAVYHGSILLKAVGIRIAKIFKV